MAAYIFAMALVVIAAIQASDSEITNDFEVPSGVHQAKFDEFFRFTPTHFSPSNSPTHTPPTPKSHSPPRNNDVFYTSNIIDVLTYGAKGDGVSDDTQAFLAAWSEACKLDSSVIEVPAGSSFLIKPVTFSGPCQSNLITIQIDGRIVAPTNVNAWNGASLLQWIEFAKVHNLILDGNGRGLIDGKGSYWWDASCKAQGYTTSKSCDVPTAVRFYGSSNVTVRNLAIVNSPQAHLKFDTCQSIDVNNVSITSPAYSPNTDGIHLQDTTLATIRNSAVCSGDDCVSIQTGCSEIDVYNLSCESGHGISIGGLGKGGTKACVTDVNVHDVTVRNSENGVRIKTWQGGSGSVRGVSFHNITVVEVNNPIIIDQFYCDHGGCHNQSSAVWVTEISYRNIRGTYSQKSTVHFACSDTVPCTNIVVADIELTSVKGYEIPAYCWNSYGLVDAPTSPVSCLQQVVQGSRDHYCQA